MQIQFEEPQSGHGLLEDINPSYIDPGTIVGLVNDGIRRIQEGDKGTYENLYRTYERHLRFIIQNVSPQRGAATKLLRRLMLLQTLPLGELDNPDFVDGYTGAPLERLDLPERREPGPESLLDAIDEMEVHDCKIAIAQQSDWNAWLAQRSPYDDVETNQAFIAANLGWPGLEDDSLPLDDRGYVPEHIQALGEGQTDDDFVPLLGRCSQETKALRGEIADAIARYGNSDNRAPERIRRQVVNSMAGIGFLQRLQYEANAGANPANLATLFLRFQHVYCFASAWVRRHDPTHRRVDPFGPNRHASTILLPDNTTLEEYIELFDSELLDGVEACGPNLKNTTMTEAEIRDKCDILFRGYINNIEEHPINPRRSRHWVEGFIMSVNAGAPLRRYDNTVHTAADGAWEHWRVRISPKGAKAYARAMKNTGGPIEGNRTQAMRCFYSTARKAGEVRPPRPKRIKALRKHGLILTNGKFVNWHIAGRIHNEEGFELTVESKAKLKGMLTERGWGHAFTEVL